MAWTDAKDPGLSVRQSGPESGVIADSVFHMWVGRDSPRDAAGIAHAFGRLQSASLVVVRFDAALDWVPTALLGAERVLLPVGTLMYWHDPDPGTGRPGSATTLRSALETRGLMLSDDPELARSVFTDIFGGYRNHYSVNPFLRPVSPGDAYGDWASRLALSPDHLIVLSPQPSGDEVAGAALLSVCSDHVEVLLAGIRPDQRSRGTYSKTLGAIRDSVRDARIGPLVISTQCHNIAVQRLWARLGLEPVLAVETIHSMHPQMCAADG